MQGMRSLLDACLRGLVASVLLAGTARAQGTACPPGPPAGAEVLRHAAASQLRDRGLRWRLTASSLVSARCT
jgi:hypothetical protein